MCWSIWNVKFDIIKISYTMHVLCICYFWCLLPQFVFYSFYFHPIAVNYIRFILHWSICTNPPDSSLPTTHPIPSGLPLGIKWLATPLIRPMEPITLFCSFCYWCELVQLLWLPISHRIVFKLLFVYNAFTKWSLPSISGGSGFGLGKSIGTLCSNS